MHKIILDDSRWPLAIVRFPETLRDEDIVEHNRVVASWLERQTPFVIISDTSLGGVPSARHRKMLAEGANTHKEETRKYVVGWAMVFTSSLFRGAATAISWLAPPPMPLKTFATFAEAERWAREQLK